MLHYTGDLVLSEKMLRRVGAPLTGDLPFNLRVPTREAFDKILPPSSKRGFRVPKVELFVR